MFNGETTKTAVSAVVGIILMVSITVVLTSSIGIFVLDQSNDAHGIPQASVTISQVPNATGESNYNVSVKIVALENADYVSVTDDGTGIYKGGDAIDSDGDGEPSNDASEVGTTITAYELEAGDTVTVIGSLNDKVVIKTYLVDDYIN